MTDPWFMLMLMEKLGPNFNVIDKAASISFLKVGTGNVFAEFKITPEML